MNAEGWYIDPFGHHEARWFSDGTPTALVRDGGAEAHDPPPDSPITSELQRPTSVTVSDGRDLKRADNAEGANVDPHVLSDKAEVVVVRSNILGW